MDREKRKMNIFKRRQKIMGFIDTVYIDYKGNECYKQLQINKGDDRFSKVCELLALPEVKAITQIIYSTEV